MIKPEIAKLIIEGVREYNKGGDKRRTAGCLIARECHRLRKNFYETRGVLLAWNLRNHPPLPVSEIENILHSAFSPAKTLVEELKPKKQIKEEILAKQMTVFK